MKNDLAITSFRQEDAEKHGVKGALVLKMVRLGVGINNLKHGSEGVWFTDEGIKAFLPYFTVKEVREQLEHFASWEVIGGIEEDGDWWFCLNDEEEETV